MTSSCRKKKSPTNPHKGPSSPKDQSRTEDWKSAAEESGDENESGESNSVKKLSGDRKGGRKGDSVDKDTPVYPLFSRFCHPRVVRTKLGKVKLTRKWVNRWK